MRRFSNSSLHLPNNYKIRMRKIWMTVLVLSALNYADAQGVKKDKKPKEYVYPSNLVKLNLTSLLFKTFCAQYEYKLTNRWSIAPSILYRPNSGMVLFKAYADNGGQGITPNAQYSYGSMTMARLALTVDAKYYLKKRAPRGLYLSPFIRYRRDKNDFDYRYYESNISTTNQKVGQASMIERTVGVGVLFGYQIVNRNKLAVDFWFLGPWFGNRNTTIQSKLTMGNLNQIDKNSIASDLEEVGAVPVKYTNDGVKNTVVNYGGGVRMIGVHLGYNF